MEAVRLSRLIDRSTTATRDEIKSEISSSLMSNVKRQQLARVPVRKISENGKAKVTIEIIFAGFLLCKNLSINKFFLKFFE